nr:hypothetical protein [Rhodoplanes elegans]
MIEVIMRVDDGADRLAELIGERGSEGAGEALVLLGVDDEKRVAGVDRAGVGFAVGTAPHIGAGADRLELGVWRR